MFHGPIRVTHILFDFDRGGLESVVEALARAYAGSDVVMSVITLGGRSGETGDACRDLLDQYHILRPMPVVSLALPAGLVRTLRRTRPDVVHVHSGAWWKGVYAARLAGVKRIVYTEHGLLQQDPALGRWLRRRAAGWTDRIVPVSPRLLTHLDEVEHVAADRLQLVENGVDVGRFSPGAPSTALRERLRIPAEAQVIGSLGRLEPVKAYHVLIEAFARLVQQGTSNPYLVLAGEGSERARLRESAERLSVAERVRFPGWVSEADDYYRLFDVFALTSESEGLPMSLLEAMASGSVPLVTRVGAMPHALGSDLEDQVVPVGDVHGVQRRLRAVLADPDYAARAGEVARARVVARYSVQRMADEYEEIYRTNGRRRGAGAR